MTIQNHSRHVIYFKMIPFSNRISLSNITLQATLDMEITYGILPICTFITITNVYEGEIYVIYTSKTRHIGLNKLHCLHLLKEQEILLFYFSYLVILFA